MHRWSRDPVWAARYSFVLAVAVLLGACSEPTSPRIDIAPPHTTRPSASVAVTGADFTMIPLNSAGSTIGGAGGVNDAGHAGGSEYGVLSFGQGYTDYFWGDVNAEPSPVIACCGIAATINNADQIVGWGGPFPQSLAFVWSASTGVVYPPLLPGHGVGQAQSINNRGVIVGMSTDDPNRPHAVVWEPTSSNTYTVTELPTLPGDVSAVAYAVNDGEQIVGQSSNAAGENHAVLWKLTGPATFAVAPLGTLGGTQSSAWAINGAGVITGKSLTSTGSEEAFLWTPDSPGVSTGSMQTLGPGWGRGISDNGIVVGDGASGFDGWVWTQLSGRSALPAPTNTTVRPEGINRTGTAVAGSYRVSSAGTQYPLLWKLRNSAPVARAGGPYTGGEGSAITLDGSGSTDADGDALTYDWDFGDGTAHAATVKATHVYVNNGSYTVTLVVSDGRAQSQPVTATVNVTNAVPTLNAFTPSVIGPVPTGTQIPVTASFTDAGTADTHTALVNWDDGAGLQPITSFGTITEDHTGGGGTISVARTYTLPGVYTIQLQVADNDGGQSALLSAGTTTLTQYVVVYDPSAGFVTGGGWINSPAGAYVPNASLTGKATFGFVAKYQKGATKPDGSTEFDFHVASLDFQSTSYDWLVVSNSIAQYKGVGTLNGQGSYAFLLTATDGDVRGGSGADKFRIKVWDTASGAVIYDNGLGSSTDLSTTSDPQATGTTLGGGSVTIQTR